MPEPTPAISSLVWATDIDVLAPYHRLERRSDHWVIRSPGNPTYWWGNFLLFDDAPQVGDGERWQALFADAFGDAPAITHMTLAWDRTDGEPGAAHAELVTVGFELEVTAGLIAAPTAIRFHPRANAEVEVVTLDPVAGQDEDLWCQVVELQLAEAPAGLDDDYHRDFLATRQRGLRERFRAGDGAWYVALDVGGAAVGSLGIVVTAGRARYQTVDTAAAHRRRGVATRLVADAARHITARYAASGQPIETFVMAADPEYHAIGIYESLGFTRAELVTGAMRKPARG